MREAKKNMYFIGIGGIGMFGLAEYFLSQGYAVSGSDEAESQITEKLAKMGAEVTIGNSSENIIEGINTVVYTSAVKDDNPELLKAKSLGIRTIKRAEMLGEIVNDKFLIAVSGTHGKTTTTAMLAKLLIDAGLDPLVFVGGNVSLFNGSAARFGTGKYAVVEADEYDRSFLTLKPDTAIITNIDEDHLDIYSGIGDIKNTFKQFCENSKAGAEIIYCGDDENINSFIPGVNRKKISYGFNESNDLKINSFSVANNILNFSIMNSVNTYKDISLNLPGRHNVLNSAACFAASKVLGIDFEMYKKSIADFKTVDRRLQMKHDSVDLKVYDDYAHHPKEIAASLKGLKEMYPDSNLISVFQPHLYSRTKDFYVDFAKELSIADKILLMDIYPAREKPVAGVTSELIFDELIKLNKPVIYFHEKQKLIEFMLKDIKMGVIVFQGAGDITLFCDEFVDELSKNR